jgi:hypothetical protein
MQSTSRFGLRRVLQLLLEESMRNLFFAESAVERTACQGRDLVCSVLCIELMLSHSGSNTMGAVHTREKKYIGTWCVGCSSTS